MADPTSAHILVVDDEAEVRALLRTGLEREGFAVSEAKDGASSMAVLEKGTVDLITLDVRLSGEMGSAWRVRSAPSKTCRLSCLPAWAI